MHCAQPISPVSTCKKRGSVQRRDPYRDAIQPDITAPSVRFDAMKPTDKRERERKTARDLKHSLGGEEEVEEGGGDPERGIKKDSNRNRKEKREWN